MDAAQRHPPKADDAAILLSQQQTPFKGDSTITGFPEMSKGFVKAGINRKHRKIKTLTV
jgi:hypothetical protein